MSEVWRATSERKALQEAREEGRLWRRLAGFGVKKADIREQTYKIPPSTLLLLQIAELYLDGHPTKSVVASTGLARTTVDRLRQTRFSNRLQNMIEQKRREVLKGYSQGGSRNEGKS